MAKKNKKNRDEMTDIMPDNEGTSLEDFIVPQKITAFTNAYEPCQPYEATEKFDDARLREFFKAYVCTCGDPLSVYLDRLANLDPPFVMTVAITGEPALHVRRKVKAFTEVPMLDMLMSQSHEEDTY